MLFINLSHVSTCDFYKAPLVIPALIRTEFSKFRRRISSDRPIHSHRVQRNFPVGFTAFSLHTYSFYTANCHGNDSRNGIRKKKRPGGNHGAKRLILPPKPSPTFLDILISAISWSARWDTRSICVSCIFHGTNGFRATIADIGRSIPFLQDDREYRGLSANVEEAGGRTGAAEGETWSLSWERSH